MLGLDNEVAALDFDMACAMRLLKFDNESAELQAKRIAYEVAVALFGDGK